MKTTRIILGLAFVIALNACSDGDEDGTPDEMSPSTSVTSDTGQLLKDAVAAMDKLESYRQEFTFRPEGEPIVFLVDYSVPGDYYERLLESPDFAGTVELILVGDKSYSRTCDSYPNNCGEWDQGEREHRAPPSAGGLTTTVPETLGLVAIELAEGPRVIEIQEPGGSDLTRIRATLNLTRAIYENQKRFLEQQEPLEDCDGGETSAEYRDGVTTVAAPAPETCRPITVEEALAEEWEDTDFDSVPLSTIDVWVSAEGLRTDRIVIATPGKAVADEEAISEENTYFETSFSQFNGITIEEPE